MGINASRATFLLLIVTSLMISAVVCQCGLLGFCGTGGPSSVQDGHRTGSPGIGTGLHFGWRCFHGDLRCPGQNLAQTGRDAGGSCHGHGGCAPFYLSVKKERLVTPAFGLKDLSFSYGKTEALKNVSFSVGRGEYFIILGPNGSGKTTLIKIMAGIISTKNGLVELFEKPLGEHTKRELARTVAYVPQTASFGFNFTVQEAVMMGRAPHQGILGLENENDGAAATRAMELTGILDLAERKTDQLSGGELQRVTISRALCQEPKIMMLDEPTASLDMAHQIRLMDLMEQLRNRGTTIIMVSHDVNLSAMYADRLLLLKKGKVLITGAPGEVLNYNVLREAYGCAVRVDESPLDGFLRVTPVPAKFLHDVNEDSGST